LNGQVEVVSKFEIAIQYRKESKAAARGANHSVLWIVLHKITLSLFYSATIFAGNNT
jgi:hypothetical protein